jgi:TldD protein
LRKISAVILLAAIHAFFGSGLARASAFPAQASAAGSSASDNDQTLRAMHDEMDRALTRLQLPSVDKPFYVEYRIMDVDVRNIAASFGSVLSSNTARERFMSVDVRVGNYHLDSSNFLSEDGFQGFLGSTGQVGIDRDYSSLRQDLWLATDQAYKAAVTQMSLKQAFLRSLTMPPEIDDFSQQPAVMKIDPRVEPDWTSRNWDEEARIASAALKNYPQIFGTRIDYYMVYVTTYLVTSEGTTIRRSRSLASIETALDTQADDGMPLHNFYAAYGVRPADLPDAATVTKALSDAGSQLMALRASLLVPDYTGPVLFDAPAAASALAQILEPSLSGARPPLSMTPQYDAIMQRFGGQSDWTGRVGTRVLPATVTLVDDPTLKEFQGQRLLGSYDVDDEGVAGQRITIVENGTLRGLLMSRRPGPDFQGSNGHGRSSDLTDAQPLSSNLLFQSTGALNPADLRKKFLDACRDDGHQWCLEVKQMDNPALSSVHQEDFSDFLGQVSGGIASGERVPLLLYRVYVADGHEELTRGGLIQGLTMRSIRNILGIGDDPTVYTYMQNGTAGFTGTALDAFGSSQGGIPSTVIAPSFLLEEVETRGFHGEPRRVPLVEPPPLK